ncbi:MAG: hypothetical protein QN823_00570 [Nitrososphaeraceae archaeon]|nr:hypothetical protein [Nitrososphaeraceae archaeon]
MNDNNDFGFIPIKSKILPQYDDSNPQTENKVKPKTVSVAENTDTDKSNATNVVASAAGAQTENKVKPKTVSVAENTDTDKSNATNVVASAAGVKILSPSSGKQIPVGNLTIFGISTDNEKSDCTVSVDWNNQKPFQKAKATGPYGEDDYSSWTYTYSASYHTIGKGLNDLTSKLECLKNSKVTTKWHSINVSGVVTNDSNLSSDLVFHDPLGILPQLNTISTKPSADMSVISSNETEIAPSKLFANMELSKEVLVPGEIQNFTIKTSDSNSQQIAAANISVKIMQGTKILKEYNGTSDTSGIYAHSLNINSDTPSGKYDVLVSASADGYVPASLAGSFQVQRQLLVEASLLKRLVMPGDQQTIDVKVVDANTKELVSGANVMAQIGEKNEYNGTSDISGAYSHTWNITSDTPSGNNDVLISASANGYEPASLTGSFQVQRQLLVEVSLSKDPVIPGEEQAIDVKVLDANSNEAVSGADVMGKIGGKKFSATTDEHGAISYSWDTPPMSGGNSYQVVLDVSSDGYPKEMKTVSFKMDKPQNLLEPPISDYQNNVVKVKDSNNDLNNNLESTGDFPQCTNLISSIGCNIKGNDKPATDDKPAATPVTDDKPAANSDVENLASGDVQDQKSAYDFLASKTN